MASVPTTPLRASLADVLLMAARSAHTMLAKCGADGATFHLSDVTEEDASVGYGLPPALTQDAVLVIGSDDGSAHRSTASHRDIDRDCGGEGNDEIVLFEPAQPRDDLWNTRLTDHRMSGCPPMLASQVESMLPGITAKEGTGQRIFDKPFHPRGLMDDGEKMRWVPVGPDRWRGVVRMQEDGMSMSVVVTVKVVSPARIEGTNTVTLDMPRQALAMMGGRSGQCQSIARAQMTWSD